MTAWSAATLGAFGSSRHSCHLHVRKDRQSWPKSESNVHLLGTDSTLIKTDSDGKTDLSCTILDPAFPLSVGEGPFGSARSRIVHPPKVGCFCALD